MSGSLRRRSMAAIVLFTLVWPVAHAGLVARYRVDAWELFGWSMYALPAARVQVRVEVERGGETEPLPIRGETRKKLRAFARRRTALGAFAPTATLASTLFEADPSIEALTVVTREIRLDPETTRLVAHDEPHPHRRVAVSNSGPEAEPGLP